MRILKTKVGPFFRELSDMDAFAQYSAVKIVALSKPADAYDSWGINRRAPAIGDIGTIVEILRSEDGAITYVVECVNPDGSSQWLDDFTASELTPCEA